MAHRVNIMLDDHIWKELKQVPAGDRSRVVNAAIFDWLKTRQRISIAGKMDALRARIPTVSSREITDWLRVDRERTR